MHPTLPDIRGQQHSCRTAGSAPAAWREWPLLTRPALCSPLLLRQVVREVLESAARSGAASQPQFSAGSGAAPLRTLSRKVSVDIVLEPQPAPDARGK